MLTIHITTNRITIHGHANYAEQGKDIVCASVSVLGQVLLNALIEHGHNEGCRIREGFLDIHCDSSEYSQHVVNAFIQGFYMIAEQYPEHVHILEEEYEDE